MISTSWHTYPQIYALGHRYVKELFENEVLIEEKIDGSQISFGYFPENSELKIKSKGAILNVEYPEKMFAPAVDVIKKLSLHPGWTYRAEYLKSPKHNALAYERIPVKHLIIFDINSAEEEYLGYEDKKAEADCLGLETVPLLFRGKVSDASGLLTMLDEISILGGQKIEGFVVKNYYRFSEDKKVLMGKYVSESFKEVHASEWKNENPTTKDVINQLIFNLKTPARWNKAIQHLRERGELTQSPKDIGLLIKEVQVDTLKECEDMIKDALFAYARPHIQRGIAGGLAEWYKEELLKLQFEK